MIRATRGAVALIVLSLLLATGCGSQEEPAEAEAQPQQASAADYVAWGVAAENQGETGLAREYFRIALDRDPTSVTARHGLARLRLAEDDYEAAWAHLEEIWDIDPTYFQDIIPDVAVMTYWWAVELDQQELEQEAHDLYMLTWELTSEAGFQHPEAADLHWKLFSCYWPSESRDDWFRALSHLHLASQARPAWPEPLVAMAEVALAVDRPAESLWALNRARSLGARSLDGLEAESRQTIATLYLIRAQELFENVEIRFGGIYSGTRREDPAEYIEAAALLMPDSLPLHYWLARVRLSASDMTGARQHVDRAMQLAAGEPADHPEDVEQWWDTHGSALVWLRDLLAGWPLQPPVTMTNHLSVPQAPHVRPVPVWAPSGHRLAYATWSGVYVATAYQQGMLLLDRVGEFHPHGPLAWLDGDSIYASLLRTPSEEPPQGDGDEPTKIPAASRLVRVSLGDREAHLVREFPGGWMTGHLAVHGYTGRIAVTLVPFPGEEEEEDRREGYVILVLEPDGSDVLNVHRQGIPGDLAWRPDGGAVLVTDRPFAHFAPRTREISVPDGVTADWPGTGAPHPVQPLYAYGLVRNPWTELRAGTGLDTAMSEVMRYIPLTVDDSPVWSPDARFVATTVRIAPRYGLPHVMVWRRDSRLVGWMPTATDVAWSPDGSFLLWLTREPTGDHRINIGRWVGQ